MMAACRNGSAGCRLTSAGLPQRVRQPPTDARPDPGRISGLARKVEALGANRVRALPLAPFSGTLRSTVSQMTGPCDAPHYQEQLRACNDRIGKMGESGCSWDRSCAQAEKPHECPAPTDIAVANGPAEHRISSLRRAEDRALDGLVSDTEFRLASAWGWPDVSAPTGRGRAGALRRPLERQLLIGDRSPGASQSRRRQARDPPARLAGLQVANWPGAEAWRVRYASLQRPWSAGLLRR